ncbi:MAG: hypothetical protein GX042_06340 [Bacteroidales bacterium]|jgi:hypothetical protein|nr:hypothetical protein [Bacteroidales bacterium]
MGNNLRRKRPVIIRRQSTKRRRRSEQQHPGDSGTANVIYSDWTTVTFTSSGAVYSGSINAPKLTAEVLDKSEIGVYERTIIAFPSASTTYSKLPYSNESRWVKIDLEVGKIIIRSNVNSISTYRYVLIPGGVQASAAVTRPDLSNYRDVVRF